MKGEKIIQYVVEDLLALRASVEGKKTKPLMDFLLSQETNGERVSLVEGFFVGQELILIEKKNPQNFKHLICIQPKSGTVRIRRLSGSQNGSRV